MKVLIFKIVVDNDTFSDDNLIQEIRDHIIDGTPHATSIEAAEIYDEE